MIFTARLLSMRPPVYTGSAAMADYHDDIRRRLEDAGKTLMMLPMPKDGMPAGERAAWPDVLQQFWDVAGVADEGSVKDRQEALAQARNYIRLRASAAAIARLDEVLGWLLLIETPCHRKAVMARMMTHPVSEQPVYNWNRIAKALRTSRWTARRWREAGIQEIVNKLAGAA